MACSLDCSGNILVSDLVAGINDRICNTEIMLQGITQLLEVV